MTMTTTATTMIRTTITTTIATTTTTTVSPLQLRLLQTGPGNPGDVTCIIHQDHMCNAPRSDVQFAEIRCTMCRDHMYSSPTSYVHCT